MINQRKNKPKSTILIGLMILGWIILPFVMVGYIAGLHLTIKKQQEQISNLTDKLQTVKNIIVEPALEATPSATPTATPSSALPTKKPSTGTSSGLWEGKISHYSRAGCLGCSTTLTMANGQPLDDEALTIAFNKAPLGTRLKITNLDNGKSVIVTVTDRGGFERLGRIADLVPAVARALETKTDVSTVRLETL